MNDQNTEPAPAPSAAYRVSSDRRISPVVEDSGRPLFMWILLALAVLAAGGGYWWWRQHQAPTAVAAPAPAAEVSPAIEHPIEQAQADADADLIPAAPVPALNESDSVLQSVLKKLYGDLTLFYPSEMIRRIVATVDNLPRDRVSQSLMPLKPVRGKLAVDGSGEQVQIAAANAGRYAPYLRLADAVSAQKLVAVYVYFYPLFQQAYRDLGYPNGYFNDRLIVVIDDLLATPDVAAPIEIDQRGAVYHYADPQLEARSAGEKMMLRMGSANAAAVKARLREIRQQLTAHAPERAP